MIGAIAGDIIGSIYEHAPVKSTDFPLFGPRCRFTDDTVLTVAVADAILGDGDYRKSLWTLGRKYFNAGYGASFIAWLGSTDPKPYGSWGNGSAMRVSPVGFAFDSVERVLAEAKKSAEVSHNHDEGIKGAQATALAVLLARTTRSKTAIRTELESRFGYDLGRSLGDIRPNYGFDVSCQGSVPESIIAFLEAESCEEAIRNAVSLGGDSDTMGCIAGGIAEAFFGGVPGNIEEKAREYVPEELADVVDRFHDRYCQGQRGTA